MYYHEVYVWIARHSDPKPSYYLVLRDWGLRRAYANGPLIRWYAGGFRL
jgi:hypothetical protein